MVLSCNFDSHELAYAHTGPNYYDHTIGVEFEWLGSFQFSVDMPEYDEERDDEDDCWEDGVEGGETKEEETHQDIIINIILIFTIIRDVFLSSDH